MSMFATELNPTALIARQWIAKEYVPADLLFIARRDDDWVGGYKPHIMQMETLRDIIAKSIQFIDLLDTPNLMGSPGQMLQVNPAGTALEFVEPINDFLDLLDTPTDYTGTAGYFVIVNPTEDGLIFEQAAPQDEIYEARLNFSGTDDPTTVVLHSILPVPVIWSRVSTGVYRANFNVAVNANALVSYINNSNDGIFSISAYNALYVEYTHKDFTGALADVDYILSVEIKIKA
jgi:hypothetical protein